MNEASRPPPPPASEEAASVAGARRFAASALWRALPSGMRRRWWLFRPLDLIARHWPVFKRRRGVLVVRMDGIGDMVLFRGALDHYAEAFGVDRSEITVLGCLSWSGIAGEVFEGYRVRFIDERGYYRHPFYRLRVSLWLRNLAPAVVVSDAYLRRPLLTDSLVWVVGAPRTVVSRPFVNEGFRAEFTYYLSQVDEVIDTGDYPTHELIRHCRFVAALLGRPVRPAPPSIAWRERPPPLPAGGAYAVLNPGSNEPGRRWPMASYAAVAERLLARGLRVVFVGRAGDRGGERPAVLERPGVVDLAGRTALPELLDLMRHAAVVVSNDTGPAHLSIALGAPTVVVVGGGHFGSFVPYPEEARPPWARFVYREMECYHCFWLCHKRASKRDVFPCVGSVESDEVWRAVEDLLGRPAGASAAAP
jgi:ADP-heptose:LPS heptosyltransferase